MDNLGQNIAQQLIAENTLTVSLFPGAFKPPTRSHFQIVENAAKISDEVRVIIANNVREGYTPEISFKIWKQYAKLLPENVTILISKNSSPITEIYDIVKEKSNNYIVIYGKGEQDRYNSINENRDKYSNVEIVDAGNIGDISATKLREAISKRNKLQIKSLIPEGIKVNDFLMNFQLHEIKVNNPIKKYTFETKEDLGDNSYRGILKLGGKIVNSGRESVLWTKPILDNLPGLFGYNTDFTKEVQEDLTPVVVGTFSRLPLELIRVENHLDEIKINKPSTFPKELLPIKDKVDHYIKYEQPASPEIKAANIFPYILRLNKNGDINISELSIENFKPGYAGNLIKRLATYIKNHHLDEDKIPGGLAKGKSLMDIAKHHRVPQADIYKQLQKGIKIEMEHTTSKEIAKEIAMDHLWEDPKYYDKLSSIEEIKINKPFPSFPIILTDTVEAKQTADKLQKLGYKADWTDNPNYWQEFPFQQTEDGERFTPIILKANNKELEWNTVVDIKINVEDDEDIIFEIGKQEIQKVLGEIKINKPISLVVGHRYILDTSRGTGHISKRFGEYLGKFSEKHHFFQPGLGKLEIPHSEIGKRLIKDITPKEDLDEIKVNKPGLNFPIKIETPEQAQKIGKGLKQQGYHWWGKEQLDLDNPPFKRSKDFEPIILISTPDEQWGDKTIDWKYQNHVRLNESIQINPKQYIRLLNKLVEECCKELDIQKPVIKLINNDKYTLENKSYAGYFPGTNEIKVVIYGRNLADSCRSLSHELKHAQQQSKGELTQNAGEDGDKFENEANSFSGKKMREFGRKHPEIYFMKYSGDELNEIKVNKPFRIIDFLNTPYKQWEDIKEGDKIKLPNKDIEIVEKVYLPKIRTKSGEYNLIRLYNQHKIHNNNL